KPMHGKKSIIEHDGKGVFAGLPQDLEVMRYHSLIVDAGTLPEVLEITATVSNTNQKSKIKNPHFVPLRQGFGGTSRGKQRSKMRLEDVEIMGLRHKKYPIEGIQFHPESFGTEGGKKMVENFLFQKVLKIKDQKSNIKNKFKNQK
ncbi:hypothetical protein KJ980_04510, partial [Patescibacteria group bacterium]|nr:hypothetical protein [Patescibacteria group bacterium]